jgi:hypothetical protein
MFKPILAYIQSLLYLSLKIETRHAIGLLRRPNSSAKKSFGKNGPSVRLSKTRVKIDRRELKPVSKNPLLYTILVNKGED